jgi:hypothetical protein
MSGAAARYDVLPAIGLPLAVLGVLGWRRLRLPRLLAAASLLASVVPGALYTAHTAYDFSRAGVVPYTLDTPQLRALRYVERAPGPGGVLPAEGIGSPVPAFTGRWTWMAFHALAPEFDGRQQKVWQLFGGQLAPDEARRLVLESGARFVIADCTSHFDLGPALAPLGFRSERFGCVVVHAPDLGRLLITSPPGAGTPRE